jgi:acyl transferase domain-containing protein
VEGDRFTSPSYWLGHDEARPILFMRGIQTLEQLGCDTFLEVGPAPVLLHMCRRCFEPGTAQWFEWIASMESGRDEAESVLIASRGLGVVFGRPSQLAPKPVPWTAPLLRPLLGVPRKDGKTTVFVSDETSRAGAVLQLFAQHRVFNTTVLTGASHILLAAAAQLVHQRSHSGAHRNTSSFEAGTYVELADAVFEKPFIVPDGGVSPPSAEQGQMGRRC